MTPIIANFPASPDKPLIVSSEEKDDALNRHLILALSHDAIFITDIRGRIQFWNNGAEQMFGYSARQARGRTCHALLQAEYPVDAVEIERQLTADGHWEGEVTYATRNGIRLVTSVDGNYSAAMVIARPEY